MLQKIRAHTQGWMAWLLLILLAIVFTLWGVSGELMSGQSGKAVAKVAGEDISAREVNLVYDRMAQQSQMAQVMAGVQTPIINEEAVRKQALESVIIERVLSIAAKSQGFLVTAEQVNNILLKLPQFQVKGEFSPSLYERIIRQMNFTPESFRQLVQNEMLIAQAQSTIRDSAFVLPYQFEQAYGLVNQQRDIQYALFDASTFIHEVKLTPEDLEAYYNGHHAEFMTDEGVMVAYVEVDKDKIAQKVQSTMQPTQAELLQGYEDKIVSFTSPETRSAKHILVAVKPDASPEIREKAKEKAQGLLDKLKGGASFSELAKTNSDDPGSASQGGELGSFGRGEMVPEFENAVFNHNAGDLVGPVKTDFGYHVVLIGSVKPAMVKPFEEVKQLLIRNWIEDKVADEFEKCLADIDQIAFEHSDSLEKVSEEFQLSINKMAVLADSHKNVGLATNPKVQQASFSEDVLYAHKNSDVLRISADSAVVLRVVEHNPPVLKPFDSVKLELEKAMTERQALYLAREKANAVLSAYKKGESSDELAKQQGFTWTTAKDLSRQNTLNLPLEVVQAAFSIPQAGKAVMTGAELPERGSALILIDDIHPGKLDPQYLDTATKEFTESLTEFKGVRDFNFYVIVAKEKANIKEF